MPDRVPMPMKRVGWIQDEDVNVSSVKTPRVASSQPPPNYQKTKKIRL